jgi:hypothetical protein
LKKGGIVSDHWAWFSDDNEKIVVWDPDKGKEILEDVGFKIVMKPYNIRVVDTKRLGEVMGMKCTVREHQIDPVCAWRKRMTEVKRDPIYLETKPTEKRIPVLDYGYGVRKLYPKEQDIYDKEGKEALEKVTKQKVIEVLESTKGPEVAGGFIKSPTGSGKTVMGMVIIGTMGEMTIKEIKDKPSKEPKKPAAKPAKAFPPPKPATPKVQKELTREEVEKQVRDMRAKNVSYADIEKHFKDKGIDYVKRSFIYRVSKKDGGGK